MSAPIFFTTDQFNALNLALAGGTLKVKYGDKEVTYRSLKEMMDLRQVMAQELGLNTKKVQRKYAEFSKGTETNINDDTF